jgi:hypothetical protein
MITTTIRPITTLSIGHSLLDTIDVTCSHINIPAIDNLEKYMLTINGDNYFVNKIEQKSSGYVLTISKKHNVIQKTGKKIAQWKNEKNKYGGRR